MTGLCRAGRIGIGAETGSRVSLQKPRLLSYSFFGSCGHEGAQGFLSGICAQMRSEQRERNGHFHELLWFRLNRVWC